MTFWHLAYLLTSKWWWEKTYPYNWSATTGSLKSIAWKYMALKAIKMEQSYFNPVHVFLHFGTFGLKALQLILASKLSELEPFENFAAYNQFRKQKRVKMTPKSNCYHYQALKMCLWVGWCCPGSKIEF